MPKVLHGLSRSPIVRVALICAVLVGVALTMWPTPTFNDFGDAFAISAGVLIVVRFGVYAVQALQEPHPDGADVLIAAVTTIAIAIAGIRILRWVGLELGIITSPVINVFFGACTAVMVFGMFLLVAAPPMRYGTLKLSARCATVIALGSGLILALLVMAVHRRWY